MKLLIIFISLVSPLFAKVTVSNGEFDNKVNIYWVGIPEAEFYSVERSFDTPYCSVLGKTVPVQTNVLVPATKTTNHTDDTIPYGMYTYTIKAFKTNQNAQPIEIAVISEASGSGYRQVSDHEFFLSYQRTIDSSLPRINSMGKLNAKGEKMDGWRDGFLTYQTGNVFKRPFLITITYNNFADQNLTLNGTYETQIGNLVTQSGVTVGTIDVTGIYNGTVVMDLIIKKGKAAGGNYKVKQGDGEEVLIAWDATPHPVEDTMNSGAATQFGLLIDEAQKQEFTAKVQTRLGR